MTRYTHADHARYDALQALNWPTRIDQALQQLAHATSPLHGTSNDTARGNGTHSDPTSNGFTAEQRYAQTTRRLLLQAINERIIRGQMITRILDEWAPLPQKGGMGDTENASLWCPNHLKHGRREPRGIDGTRHCRWCSDVNRSYGRYPNASLIEQHHTGRRISDTEYRRQLGKGAA